MSTSLRVASVPFDQVYIWHCGPPPGDPVVFERLPDPPPAAGQGTVQSRWWPPAMLAPGWIESHADDFDVMHIQFGFDALSPDELAGRVAALRHAGKPLVYTVHDLYNPHHADPAAHDASLDVLVPAADALITLTAGAADEIRRRWNRVATVLPHPHVVALDRLAELDRTPRPVNIPKRVGVHLKSLRPNMAAQAVVDGLVAAAAEVPGVRIIVDTHPEVMTGGGDSPNAGIGRHLAALRRAGQIELNVHPFFTDDELWRYLRGLDASVLPYRWGTHSGWLEECLDVGTAVIAPTCGYYAEQRPVLSYRLDRSGLDQASLTAAVRAIAHTDAYPRLTSAERLAERRRVAAEHARIYRGLLQ